MKNMEWHSSIEDYVHVFIKIAHLAGITISRSDIGIEFLDAPHKPTALPLGKVAVYIFKDKNQVLKVGKVGPNSGPRYLSQHYRASAPSTLCKSIMNDLDYPLEEVDETGTFIKDKCDRANILVPEEYYPHCISLMEIFFHIKLNPKYEG